ncbi:MAG: alpha/beta hydrolase [Acidobacteriia bacterium]|nr:alpha/beta hydrolase [Terriglobia bacterium]
MRNDIQPSDPAKKRVLYQIPGMDTVPIRRDVEYRATEAGVLTMDIYYPTEATSGLRTPAVVFVSGFSDLGFQKMLGCKLKEMGSYISWAQLAAASGLVAITYTNREPIADAHLLLQYVRQNAALLGIDETRIGLWACSGNVPMALSLLMQSAGNALKCAVLCYGYLLDLEGFAGVAEAAKAFGFVNPCAGKLVDDLPQDISLFMVRAGHDESPHLNEAMDRFLVKALARNLPITVVNHSTAPHAFDLMHDSDTTREIIIQILAFMRLHLLT